MEFRGISRILRASLYNMYEFEYFKSKYERIESKISGLAVFRITVEAAESR